MAAVGVCEKAAPTFSYTGIQHHSPQQHPMSNNTLACGDVQHIVASIMSAQEANQGVMYLQCHAVPEPVRNTIWSGNKPFCLVGCVEVFSEAFADGSHLMLQFTVPPDLSHQSFAFSEAKQEFEPLAPSVPFGGFTVKLDPRDADKWIQQAPSPMYVAINKQHL